METQIESKGIDTANHIKQSEARELLERLCEQVFGGDEARLALALGRPTEEIQSWLNGEETFDEDVATKMHGLLHERAFH